MKKSILLVFLTVFSLRVQAQDIECSREAISTTLQDYAAEIENGSDPVTTIAELNEYTSQLAAICGEDTFQVDVEAESEATNTSSNRITFTSDEEGLQPVIGPITIPDGVWRVTATTVGFMIADLEPISGTCQSTSIGSLFNISGEQAIEGVQRLLITDTCEALINISNTREAWTLEFTQVTSDDITSLENRYSSEDYGLQPVIGPIEFADGLYRVTATTTGFLIADVVTVAGECETDRFSGLFNLSQGQGDTGAQTTLTTAECIAFITIENTRNPWTLEFENLR